MARTTRFSKKKRHSGYRNFRDLPALQPLTGLSAPSSPIICRRSSDQRNRWNVKGQLQDLAAKHHTTLYTVLLSAYYTLLAKYTPVKRNRTGNTGVAGVCMQTGMT
ncbi:hypothetical protein ACEQPO_02170 [Bacillus sp. SL00103]